jgi:hypothetical protein
MSTTLTMATTGGANDNGNSLIPLGENDRLSILPCRWGVGRHYEFVSEFTVGIFEFTVKVLIVKSCQKKVCPLGGTWKTFEHFSDHEV